jgi:hypothetical protein
MVQTFHPPLMEVAQETVPELQPVFAYINSHTSKLYQEGYFLKLHDLDSSKSGFVMKARDLTQTQEGGRAETEAGKNALRSS